MFRRVLAWILLIGFAFLIVNILLIGFYREISIGLYAIIAVFYIFTGKKSSGGEA